MSDTPVAAVTSSEAPLRRLRHPFDAIPDGKLALGVVPAAVFVALVWTVFPFVFPYPDFDGIAALVLSGSAEGAAAVVSEWSIDERLRVAFWGGFDFLVDFAFWTGTALSCIWAGRVFGTPRAAGIGALLAWACWFGFLLNVPENLTFILLTMGPVSDPWPAIAAGSAVLRIALIVAGAIYPGLAVIALLRRRRAR